MKESLLHLAYKSPNQTQLGVSLVTLDGKFNSHANKEKEYNFACKCLCEPHLNSLSNP